MKKSFIFCLCVAIIALFTACNKNQEGVFNPSKKIQKTYIVNQDGEKELTEVWHWDGKVLSSIDYIDNSYPYTVYFSYDNKNRVIAADEAGGAHTEFIYDGKYIQKIQAIYEGVVVSTAEFDHENGKISEMRLSDILGKDGSWSKMHVLNPLRYVIPEAFPAVEKAMEKCAKDAKGDDQIVIRLHWKGDNVNTMELSFPIGINQVTETVEITYDKKNNPMYGLFASLGSDAAVNLFVNKNNPLNMKYSYMGTVVEEMDFTYEYEDNFPTTVTMMTSEDGVIDVQTVIYEY